MTSTDWLFHPECVSDENWRNTPCSPLLQLPGVTLLRTNSRLGRRVVTRTVAFSRHQALYPPFSPSPHLFSPDTPYFWLQIGRELWTCDGKLGDQSRQSINQSNSTINGRINSYEVQATNLGHATKCATNERQKCFWYAAARKACSAQGPRLNNNACVAQSSSFMIGPQEIILASTLFLTFSMLTPSQQRRKYPTVVLWELHPLHSDPPPSF